MSGQIFYHTGMKKNSICNTYLFLFLKQWAAVRIHHTLRIDPPQRWFPPSRIRVCHGKSTTSAGTPPMISKASDFSELFILWPHFTKSRKKEEGGETQRPTVKVGWLGRHLSMMPLSHPPAHRQQWLSQFTTRWEIRQTKTIPCTPTKGTTIMRLCFWVPSP